MEMINGENIEIQMTKLTKITINQFASNVNDDDLPDALRTASTSFFNGLNCFCHDCLKSAEFKVDHNAEQALHRA